MKRRNPKIRIKLLAIMFFLIMWGISVFSQEKPGAINWKATTDWISSEEIKTGINELSMSK
jgi:hypothetical protein